MAQNGEEADVLGKCPMSHLHNGSGSGSAEKGHHSAMRTSLTGTPNRRVSFQADEMVEDGTSRAHEHGSCPFAHAGHHKAHPGDAISMKKIVDELYRRVLADERLAPFYENINMVRLKNQQEKVMMFIFGGEELIKEMAPDLDMRKIHTRAIAKQGLNLGHWEAFVEHLRQTLEDMPTMPAESKESALRFVAATRAMFRPLEPAEVELWNREHPDDLLQVA